MYPQHLPAGDVGPSVNAECDHEWFYAADGVRCGYCDVLHPDCKPSQTRSAMRNLSLVAGGDPDGLRSVASARAAFVRGQIDLAEFERRVERLQRGQQAYPVRTGRRF